MAGPWTPPDSDQIIGQSAADALGRPVIVPNPKPAPTQGKTIVNGYVVDPNTATAVPVAGLPETAKDKDNWRMLTPNDPEFDPSRHGFVDTTNGDVKYGPQLAGNAGSQGFGVNDYTGVLGDIGRLRAQAEAAPDTAFGPGSHSIARTFIVGTPGADMRSIYNGVSGKALREALISTNQAMGGSGAASIDRTQAGLQAMRASALHGLDPDLQTKDQFLKSLDQLQEDYTQKLAGAAQAAGGKLMRQVDQVNGKPITPIEVPWDASDDQIRQAVRNAGYTVPDNVGVNKGFSAPVTAPQNGKTAIDMTGGTGAPAAANAPASATPGAPSAGSGSSFGSVGSFLGSAYGALNAATDKAGDMATGALAYPLAAGVEDVGGRIGQFLGLNPTGAGTNFDANLARLHAERDAETNGHPIANAIGDVAGLVGGVKAAAPLASLAASRLGLTVAPEASSFLAPKGAGIVSRSVRAGLAAAPVGAVEGAANAGQGNRLSGAAKGGAIALGVGVAAVPVLSAAGNIAGWAINRLMPNGEWAVFSHLAPEATPADMRAAATQARAAGTAPAALDTLNGSSLDQVRTQVGGRPGSTAATILNNEADARIAAGPAAMTKQARAAIGQPPVPVEGATAASPTNLRLSLGATRDQQFGEAIAPIRSQQIDLPKDTAALISGGDMGSVIRAARGYTTDPHERESLNALAAWADQAQKSGVATPPPPVEIGAADALRQALNAAGSVKQADASHVAMRTAAADLTAGMEAMAPKYRAAMNAYRTQSKVAAPVPGTSGKPSDFGPEAINLGENLIGANAEHARLATSALPPLDEPVTYSTARGANDTFHSLPDPTEENAKNGYERWVADKVRRSGPVANQKDLLTPDDYKPFDAADFNAFMEAAKSGNRAAADYVANVYGVRPPNLAEAPRSTTSITPRQAVGEGVVRAVETKASKPGGMQSLGKAMASGEQQNANRVVLTPTQATNLETGVTAELKRLDAADRAAPTSAPAPETGENTAQAIATTLYHSPALKVAKSMSLIQKAKISPAQADAIARGIVDPKQTDAIIGQIEKAGYTRQRARALYGMLAIQLANGISRTVTQP